MRTSGQLMKCMSTFVLVCFIFVTACTRSFPERFVTTKEVYLSSESTSPPSDAPSDSFKRAVFQAPYEDLFRIAEVSATQMMFNVESTNKEKGQILATKVEKVQDQTGKYEKRYHYGILVKERGPKATEVIISAKMQRSCAGMSPLAAGIITVFSFGLLLPLAIIGVRECTEEKASLHWAMDNMEEMNKYMAILRNNLISAGLI